MNKATNHRGILITFSGLESSGKSTQIKRLIESVDAVTHKWVSLSSRPGYTPGLEKFKQIVRMLTGKKKQASSKTASLKGKYPKRANSFESPFKRWLWLRISLLDLIWTYCIYIRLLKIRGKVVIVDRYLIDAIVDYRVNFPQQRVESSILYKLLSALASRPERSYCLVIPAELSLERTLHRENSDRETLEVLKVKQTLYHDIAKDQTIKLIDACLCEEEIAASVKQEVFERLHFS